MNADHVHIEHLERVLGADRLRDPLDHEACVVYDDVELAAGLLEQGLERGVDARVVLHVHLEYLDALGLQLLRMGGMLARDAAHRGVHLVTRLGEGFGSVFAKSARGTGDENNLGHGIFLPYLACLPTLQPAGFKVV